MTVLLYRPSLDVTSGAGQLMLMQLRALRGAGIRAEIGCERGALRFLLRSGTVARRLPRARVSAAGEETFVVDHGLCTPTAALAFVHNVAAEARVHLARADWDEAARAEHAYFAALARTAPIVANSSLAKAAIVRQFGVEPERVLVIYPGYRAARFNRDRVAALRTPARRSLGVGDEPLVGLITSGDFAKRGLDVFLAAAEIVAAVRPDVRFLVVGSKRLPEHAREHPLVASGRVLYRPKGRVPERWFAALDVFVYPACFEEFGMVVSEAQAMGVPIVTSRVVGAAECLPRAYDAWLDDAPDAERFARRTLALLADDGARSDLARSSAEYVRRFDDRAYARATVAIVSSTISSTKPAATRDQNRRLK